MRHKTPGKKRASARGRLALPRPGRVSWLVPTMAVVPGQDAHALCLAQAAEVEAVAQVVEGALEVQPEVVPVVPHHLAVHLEGAVALDGAALLQLVAVAHQAPVV